jgi:hypothetical protein
MVASGQSTGLFVVQGEGDAGVDGFDEIDLGDDVQEGV